MELDAEIDVPAHGLPDRGKAGDEIIDPGRLAEPVMFILEEQDLEGGVALVVDGAARGVYDNLGGSPVDHSHRPHRGSGPAAEELPDGDTETLALQIPERLIDRADRSCDCHPAEARSVR